MKSFSLLVLLLVVSCAGFDANQAGQLLEQVVFVDKGGDINQSQAAYGLKEALNLGLKKSVGTASSTDGFLKNPLIKIPFPEEAQKVERTLRSVGLSKLADEVVFSFNRAAEKASAKALPIFASALKQMSFKDAMNILLGSQKDAATSYFKLKTTNALSGAFAPVIKKAISDVNATKYWGDAMSSYNKIPFVKPINTDLTNYITNKSMKGIFSLVAKEEMKIRENPRARATKVLKRVFGWADEQKSDQK